MKIFKNPKDEFIFTLVMLPVTIIAACVILTIKGVMNIEEASFVVWLLVQVFVIIIIARFLIKLNESNEPKSFEYYEKKFEEYMEDFKKELQAERARREEYQNNKNGEER